MTMPAEHDGRPAAASPPIAGYGLLDRERIGELHPQIQAVVADLADTAVRRRRDTDFGMWEMRGEPRHHLSSKVGPKRAAARRWRTSARR